MSSDLRSVPDQKKSVKQVEISKHAIAVQMLQHKFRMSHVVGKLARLARCSPRLGNYGLRHSALFLTTELN